MPMFMDVHEGMTGITKEQLREEHEKDLKMQGKDVRFIKAWADPKAGVVFCLSEGPSREAIEEVHKKAGHPADEVYELALEVD